MADNTKRWLSPFAASGDKTAIPEDSQPSGAISYPQGFGPDYERDPATDPLAKRVPREETNQLYFDVTDNLKQLQEIGAPWFITSAANGGVPFAYAQGARVLWDNGSRVDLYQSLTGANTTIPSDTTNWMRIDPARFGTLAEVVAAALATVMVSPSTLSRAVQGGSWSYAVAGGTANALTAALNPVPASNAALTGAAVRIAPIAANTGATTLNVNGLGALPVLGVGGAPLIGGELVAGGVRELVCTGTAWVFVGLVSLAPLGVQNYDVAGSYTFTPPAGVRWVKYRIRGGGGGGGGSFNIYSGATGGGGGGYVEGIAPVTPGVGIAVTVGAGGAAGVSGGGNGTNGGSSSLASIATANGGTMGRGASSGASGALELRQDAGSGGGFSGGQYGRNGSMGNGTYVVVGGPSGFIVGGTGGACFGGAGSRITVSGPGGLGLFAGDGGGGASALGAGGTGQPGLINIEMF